MGARDYDSSNFSLLSRYSMSTTFGQNLIRIALRTLMGLVLTVVLAVGGYLLFAYNFTYSQGEPF